MKLTKRGADSLMFIGVGFLMMAVIIAFAAFDSKVMAEQRRIDQFRARCNSVFGNMYAGNTEYLCYVNGKVVLSEK